MGWGNKAIEIRSVESGHLDGVFMHKKVREYVKKHFAIEGQLKQERMFFKTDL